MSYDTLQTSSAVNDELSLALRGMAVEDDYNVQNRQHGASSQSTSAQTSHPRAHPMPQPRPYSGYPQADYPGYYSVPAGRESYVEYPYGYDAYRGPSDPSLYASSGVSSASPAAMYPGVSPQTLHPNAVADMQRQQAGMFYDYAAASRPPGSQFYYPTHQAVMFPAPAHSPMITPQLAASNPATLADKKREMQASPLASGLIFVSPVYFSSTSTIFSNRSLLKT